MVFKVSGRLIPDGLMILTTFTKGLLKTDHIKLLLRMPPGVQPLGRLTQVLTKYS